MQIHEFEFTITLGRSGFIHSWLCTPPSSQEAYIGKLLSEETKNLCLEGIFSSKGKLTVSPDSLLILFSVPEEQYSNVFIPDFIFQNTGTRISLSTCDFENDDYITNHFNSENNLIAQSYTVLEEELNLCKILLILNVSKNVEPYIENSIKKALESM